jgi:cytochrome c556
MFRTPFVVAAALASLAVAACGKPAAPQPQASFQEVMLTQVDASADALWGATGSVVDATGDHSLSPKTEEDWRALRAAVVTLTEASDLLTTEGRPLVHPGQKIQDEGAESVASPDWIRQAFVTQRPLLLQRAGALKAIAGDALVAVDRRDLKALDEIGERLDAACEACHESFWYPPAAKPAGEGVLSALPKT